jgi:hypothetical protein
MRLPRVRFTIRWMMVGVAVAGFGAWLIRVVEEVANDPNGDVLYCVYQSPLTGEVSSLTQCNPRTFWARFARRLTGRPWPGDYRCPCGDGPHAPTLRGQRLRLLRTFDQIEVANAFMVRLRADTAANGRASPR